MPCAVGSSALGDVNSFLTKTLGVGDWSGLQPVPGPAIPTQQASGWATVSLHAMDGGTVWNLFPPPQIGPELPIAR